MRILAAVLVVLMSATIALATPLDITNGAVSVLSNRSYSYQDAIFYGLQGDRVGIQGYYEQKLFTTPGLAVQMGLRFSGGYNPQLPQTRINVDGFEPCVAISYQDDCGTLALKTDPLPMGIDFTMDTVTIPFQAMGHLQVGENCPIHFGVPGNCPGVDVIGQGLVSIHWVHGFAHEINSYFPEAQFRFYPQTSQTSTVPEAPTLAFLPVGLLGLLLARSKHPRTLGGRTAKLDALARRLKLRLKARRKK